MNELQPILEQVKDIDIRLLNHTNPEIRHKWADKSNEVLGHRSHWGEVDDLPSLQSMVAFAKELLS